MGEEEEGVVVGVEDMERETMGMQERGEEEVEGFQLTLIHSLHLPPPPHPPQPQSAVGVLQRLPLLRRHALIQSSPHSLAPQRVRWTWKSMGFQRTLCCPLAPRRLCRERSLQR